MDSGFIIMSRTIKVGSHTIPGVYSGFYEYLKGIDGIARIGVDSIRNGRGSPDFGVSVKYYSTGDNTFKLEVVGKDSRTSWRVQIKNPLDRKRIEDLILDYKL